MLNKATTRTGRSAAQGVDAFMFPGFTFNVWAPALSFSGEWNAKLGESFANLGSEWQEFVSRRMQDDLSLLQQMGSSQSPEQAWTTYVKFWQKAAEDYAREFATMSRLTGDIVNSSITGLQQRMQATASELQPTAKAA